MELRFLMETTDISSGDVIEVADLFGCSRLEAKQRIIEKLNKPRLQYRNQDYLGWIDVRTEYININIEELKSRI